MKFFCLHYMALQGVEATKLERDQETKAFDSVYVK